jgi:glutathione peroxidase
MDKIHVKGADQSPLYAALTGPGAKFPGDVKWNFGKFLIGRNGEVLARFEPSIKPDNPEVVTAITEALKAPSQK